MMRLMQHSISTCCLLLLLPFNASANDNTFTFTAIPDQDQSRLVARFSKLEKYLSEQLNIKVKYLPVKSYASAITAFRRNDVQLAWFGGLSGVRARALVPGSEAIAQGIEDQFFKTYIIAHHSTGLSANKFLSNKITGMTFTFGAKGSTSGRLMPEYYLTTRFNQSTETLFKRVGFSGNHSRTITLVEAGAYQLGAVNYQVFNDAIRLGKVDPNLVSVIWETPIYPDYQWTIRGDINRKWGAGFRAKVINVILALDDPEVLSAFPRSGFIRAKNSDYDIIAQTARKTNLLD